MSGKERAGVMALGALLGGLCALAVCLVKSL